ncbi:septum site-determining protein MinC [Paucibacter sp. O1-1]|nr:MULTISPECIES: septum site-determining protein MinC [unclassified Roseateles]MCU7376545.1 septum site-determining protein MinC [Paucibacter sp. O1-1]MCZ7883945.1 septum site-determining protein MinC [Paucibacter sp. M5-1]MDA3831564.1 septum site-determining protein MinC [Paucibacter sp. O1-1]MDC6168767.1 septum site-determining protein MinC [Paucibacter sp. XJ19-41]
MFELKSASLSLLTLVLKTGDLTQLSAELRQRLGGTPEVFNHDPLLIDFSQLPQTEPGNEPGQAQLSLDAEPPIDLPALLALLREYRMQPVAVVGAGPGLLARALALGLAEAPEPEPVAPRAEARVETVVQEVVREVVHEVVREVPGDAVKTLVIDKPLRSGQQVYAKGGDLVVLALVNHGAEVIADGHIHVYAPLRGKAIAGARGNTDARIFATSMEAELIAIAGIYRTTENPLPDTVFAKPAQIRLEGEKLVMEPLKL